MNARILMSVVLALATVLILGLAGVATSCQQGSDTQNGPDGIKDTSAFTLADLQPLDDPEGPYYGLYEEPDRWIVENAAGVSKGPSDGYMRSKSNDELYMFTVVDNQGWVVPGRHILEQRAEAKLNGVRQQGIKDKYWLHALGPQNELIADRAQDIGWEVEADCYQPVPEWLVAAPPKGARLLPNGEIVTRGMLGSGDVDEEPEDDCGSCWGSGDDFWRYDSTGHPVCSSSDPRWVLLYRDFRIEGWPEGTCGIRGDGYFIFFDADDIEGYDPDYAPDLYQDFPVKSVYDYDGTLLDFTRTPPRRSHYGFNELQPASLRELFRAQLRTGRN